MHSLIRRMSVVWLALGALLALTTWFVPSWVTLAAVVVVTAACSIGIWNVARHLPRMSLRVLWEDNRYPSRSRLVILIADVVTVMTIAVGAAPVTVPAAIVLALLALAHWKVNWTLVERRLRARRGRRRTLGAALADSRRPRPDRTVRAKRWRRAS